MGVATRIIAIEDISTGQRTGYNRGIGGSAIVMKN